MSVNDKAGTLRAESGGHQPVVFNRRFNNGFKAGGVKQTMTVKEAQNANILVLGNGQGHDSPSDKAHALNTMHDQQIVVHQGLRRLTPLECERLQGLPDNWTDVPLNGKPASDSARYKAIGNGMAQPCADFILQCVKKMAEKRE